MSESKSTTTRFTDFVLMVMDVNVTEHFPKSTLTATAWCLKCNRNTEHRIDDGRVGPCLDESHPAPPLPKAQIPKLGLGNQPEQKDLFEK